MCYARLNETKSRTLRFSAISVEPMLGPAGAHAMITTGKDLLAARERLERSGKWPKATQSTAARLLE